MDLMKNILADEQKKRKLMILVLAGVIILAFIWLLAMVSRNWRGGENGMDASSSGELTIMPSETEFPTDSPTAEATLKKTVKPSITAKNTPTIIPTPLPTFTPTPTLSSDTQAPVFDYINGPENGSTVTYNSFCFPMKLVDNVSPNTLYVRYGLDTDDLGEWKTDFAPCYSSISNGSHIFKVQGKDSAGNETAVTSRSFTINADGVTPTNTVIPTFTLTPTQAP